MNTFSQEHYKIRKLLTPGSVFVLCNAFTALSASSLDGHITKQHPIHHQIEQHKIIINTINNTNLIHYVLNQLNNSKQTMKYLNKQIKIINTSRSSRDFVFDDVDLVNDSKLFEQLEKLRFCHLLGDLAYEQLHALFAVFPSLRHCWYMYVCIGCMYNSPGVVKLSLCWSLSLTRTFSL